MMIQAPMNGGAVGMAMQEVHVTLLEVGKHYACRCEGYEDDGAEIHYNDMCYVDETTVPGQGNRKKRQVRFCRFPKVLTLSQLVGVRFFGPLEWDASAVLEQEKLAARNPSLANLIKNQESPT